MKGKKSDHTMNSIQSKSLSTDDLRLRGLQNGREERVVANVRRLIFGMLARYSSEFFIFRELIQNADDAEATEFELEIECDGLSSASQEMDFNKRSINEIRMKNNGHVFTETDWNRIIAIAEGNTNVESIGQFGVGFYAVFSYAEEPIIISGKECMVFEWRDEKSLMVRRHQLPAGEESNITSIILKMRDEHVLKIASTLVSDHTTTEKNRKARTDNTPSIDLAQLKAYFTSVLSFTKHITKLVIKINELLVFKISKTKANVPPVRGALAFKVQSSINDMFRLESFEHTEQTFTISNGPSITVGHIVVKARVNVRDRLLSNISNILKKELPSVVQIQLLFVPLNVLIDQQRSELSSTSKDLNREILRSILPIKFHNQKMTPAGLVFIGLRTHQTTGMGIHVYTKLIPTIERENLDLVNPHIKEWNKELLMCVGQISRFMYDQISTHIPRSDQNEYYNAILAPYAFERSAPNAEIGDLLLDGFLGSESDPLVPVKSSPLDSKLSLVPSSKAFLATSKLMHSFLSLPLVPFEISENNFFTALRQYELISTADKSIIKTELASSILSPAELVALLDWLRSDATNSNSYVRHVLSVVRFRENEDSSIISLVQVTRFDASNMPSILPLPHNFLPTSVARHFSREQLTKDLHLSPCSFKELFSSYLNRDQHYLLRKKETAVCLLSLFSKEFSQFSEEQRISIQTVLSKIECIPTTQGMKLPSQSYVPSPILSKDLPAITLTILSSEIIDNSVSLEFLKEIGCHMLHIQDLIDSYSKKDGLLATSDRGTMQALIKNLMNEWKNMSDTDANALKQSKFLTGMTMEAGKETMANYMPHQLHFPSVTEELQCFTLPSIHWPMIDPHSAEYAFLKELGVREAPDLNTLVDRIVEEHKAFQSLRETKRKSYKLPIALQYFAKNFQKHYSSTWEKTYAKQPFLPSNLPGKSSHADVILLRPDEVFTASSPLCPHLLPKVTSLFQNHLNISLIGIKTQPTLTQAFDALIERKDDLLTLDWARTVFTYLSTLEGLDQKFIKRLSTIAFIPTSDAVTFMKPSQIFFRLGAREMTKNATQPSKPSALEDIDTSGLIDYVDFGLEGNSFLSSVGVLSQPSVSVFAGLLLDRQASYFANALHSSDVLNEKVCIYKECLKQIAAKASWASELDEEPLASRLKNEPWCLGVQLIEDKNGLEVSVYDIVRPAEIYLDDDQLCSSIFHPLCCPNEPTIRNLYAKFRAQWLSDCVQREPVCKGKRTQTERSKELYNLIRTRHPLLFVNNRGEKIDDSNEEHVQWLHSGLSIYEIDRIRWQLTFKGESVPLESDHSSSCALKCEDGKVVLCFRRSLDPINFFDLARELAGFVFKNPSESVIRTVKDKLSLPLETLRQEGVRVDQLLSAPTQLPEAMLKAPQPQKHKKAEKQGPKLWQKILGFPFALFGGHHTVNQFSNIGDIPQPSASDPNYPDVTTRPELSYSDYDSINRNEDKNTQESFHRGQASDYSNNTRRQPPIDKHRLLKEGPIEHFERHRRNDYNSIFDIVQGSQAYTDSTFIAPEHVRTEVYSSCTECPAVNMTLCEYSDLEIPLFLEKNVHLNEQQIDQAKQLTWVLCGLASSVFNLSVKSIHLYRDINGARIAFNYNGALFFNLRYFEQVYAKDLKTHLRKSTATDIVSTIVNFYFMVTCHELSHNAHKQHDEEFVSCLEMIAVYYMVQKETFLAEFSFDNYLSNDLSQR